MELITYKTNIRNEAALNRITPHLNKAIGSANWQLDITGTDRMLTVYSPDVINEKAVIKAVRKAGFKAMSLHDDYAVC